MSMTRNVWGMRLGGRVVDIYIRDECFFYKLPSLLIEKKKNTQIVILLLPLLLYLLIPKTEIQADNTIKTSIPSSLPEGSGFPLPPSQKMKVSYIPSQLEAPTTVAVTPRASPGKLLVYDIKLVLELIQWLPWILMPFGGAKNRSIFITLFVYIYEEITADKKRYAESSLRKENFREFLLHTVIFIFTMSSMGYAVRIAAVTTGYMFLAYSIACWAILMILCRPLNYGPRVLKSHVDLEGYPLHPRERWVFVNGICSGTRWLQGIHFFLHIISRQDAKFSD
jgi:hypothetical protein